jgi:hypothetical protein
MFPIAYTLLQIVTREIIRMLPVFEELIPGKLPYAYEPWAQYKA